MDCTKYLTYLIQDKLNECLLGIKRIIKEEDLEWTDSFLKSNCDTSLLSTDNLFEFINLLGEYQAYQKLLSSSELPNTDYFLKEAIANHFVIGSSKALEILELLENEDIVSEETDLMCTYLTKKYSKEEMLYSIDKRHQELMEFYLRETGITYKNIENSILALQEIKQKYKYKE